MLNSCFLLRLAGLARSFYVTTPAKEFPIETHTNLLFVHWMPAKIFDWVATKCWEKSLQPEPI